jgi:pimeloyl-ACP methyl ester carboxylesterase
VACRAKGFCLSFDNWALPGRPVACVGHSIGAACLVALAGATMWLRSGEQVGIPPDRRLARLALLAPPTDYFRVPGALDALQASIGIWVGSQDNVTPASQAEWLAQAVRETQTVAVRLTEGAGHFSFMDLPPPQTVEPLPDKQAFLERYSSEVCGFVVRP